VKLLVVDDSKTEATRLAVTLEDAGYEVVLAHNGRQALAVMRDEAPNLVVSDVVMPEIDGYQFCRMAKSDKTLRATPIILLTALTDPGEVIRGLEAQANYFITKPCDDEFLLARIAALLDGSQSKVLTDARGRIEVESGGTMYRVKANRRQILELLLATYENAGRQNLDLLHTQYELRSVNEQLAHNLRDLENSERRFNTLVNTIPDIVYKIDVNGCFVFINDAIQSLGYEPADLIGKHFSVLMDTSEVKRVGRDTVLPSFAGRKTGADAAPKLFDERRTGDRRTVGLEITLIGRKGRRVLSIVESLEDAWVSVEVNSSGLYEQTDGTAERALIGTVGVIRDITERKRIEGELMRLASFPEHNPNPVLELNDEGEITYVNPSTQAMFPDFLEQHTRHPIFVDMRAVISQMRGSRVKSLVDECVLAEQTYERHYTLVPGRNLVHIHIFDITERRVAEAKLERSHEELETRVRERTSDLQREKDKLAELIKELRATQDQLVQSEKLAAIGTLVAGVAHEVNNPLTGVLNYVQYAIKHVEDERISGYLRKAEANVQRAAKVVRSMLTYARERKPTDMEPHATNAHKPLDSALVLLEADLRTAGVEVVLDDLDQIPDVLADENALEQVFINLLRNSRDAMAHSETKRVEITGRSTGDMSEIIFRDTGPGISDDEMTKIFDPFFTTKPEGQGTGLGLFVCQRIVSGFGGEIQCRAGSEGGACFTIRLPRVPEKVTATG